MTAYCYGLISHRYLIKLQLTSNTHTEIELTYSNQYNLSETITISFRRKKKKYPSEIKSNRIYFIQTLADVTN